jgi:hypothetical protein
MSVMKVWMTMILCAILVACSASPKRDAAPWRFAEARCASAEETKAAPREGGAMFRILVVHGKTLALIDSIKAIDREGKPVAAIDVGSEGDTMGDNHVVISDENQWGPPRQEGAKSARCVNEGNKRSMHSSFVLKLDRPAGLRIVISYKDQGEDLMPLEIYDGRDFRRIGQILLENSGQWLEEEFRLPDTASKKSQ